MAAHTAPRVRESFPVDGRYDGAWRKTRREPARRHILWPSGLNGPFVSPIRVTKSSMGWALFSMAHDGIPEAGESFTPRIRSRALSSKYWYAPGRAVFRVG